MRTLLCLVTLLALNVAAQTLTRAPTLLRNVEPIFPPELVDAGVGGTVTTELDLGPDGQVLEARVVTSAGPAFDAAALAAVRQLVFTPAEVDGKPAAVRIQFNSQFVFTAPPSPTVNDAGFDLSPDAGPAPVNLAGTLRAVGTRELVAGALVTVGGQELTADEHGRFEAAGVPVGPVEVRVSAAGFERFVQEETVAAGQRTEVVYYLSKSGERETVVRDSKERREVAQVKLQTAEVRLIPGSNNDVFRVVQNLPGVARSPFGTAALVVRGSKAWDSRVVVDEVEVPQLFHFAGLTATFNSATIESIAFQPGNFGADYGRAIGGLVQGAVRPPSKGEVHGYVDLNVFDVSALVEAPVSREWSASAAGRFGLTQYTVPWAIDTFFPAAKATIGFALAPQSWDYQVRAERQDPGSKNRVFVTAFGSSDKWAFIEPNPLFETDISGNLSASGSTALYNRLVLGVDQKLTSRLSFVSRNAVGFDVSDTTGSVQEIYFHTQAVPLQLRERFRLEVPEAKLSLGFGFDGLFTFVTFDAQEPPPFKANQLPDPYVTRRLVAQTEHASYLQPALFADAVWAPLESLQVRLGVRVDSELGVMHQAWVDPRLQVRYSPTTWLTLKAGAAQYQQVPDWRTGVLSQAFGNPKLKPEGAWHFLGGGEAKLLGWLELDVQGYFKYLFDQARESLTTGAGNDISIPGADTRYTSHGYGRAYGLEVFLRARPTPWFLAWVSYSLSRFERDYYGGIAFAPGELDQPHNLIVVASLSLPLGFTVGGRFRFASGPLVTPFVNSIFDANANLYVPLPALPWSQRLPSFVQADLRVDKRFTFKTWTLGVYVDVQNVSNTQNPEALIYNFNYTKSAYVTGIPILPTAGVRGEW